MAPGSRYVLGVNPGLHDGSAALLRDGELVAMVEQERLSRNRHAIRESPRDAITACLAQADIGLDAVTEIAVGWDVPSIWGEVSGGNAGPFDERSFARWMTGDKRGADIAPPPLRFIEHHLAHAASAFYTSGLREAAILIVDGRGEFVATSVANGGSGGIETVKTWGVNQSLGQLYSSAAIWTGLGKWGTGKLMGLAAYGKAGPQIPLSAWEDGYAINAAPEPAGLMPSQQMIELDGRLRDSFRRNYPFGPADPADVMAYADFAASIQSALEEVILRLATIARRETGHSGLVLAGGVAMNCTANGALIRSGIFEDVWIPPFPYDAGASLGAALVADRALQPSQPTPPRLKHAFWAPDVGKPEAEALAQLSDGEVDHYDEAELVEAVAEHLANGKLVGWFQGRGEVGQRALGARSILCDPRKRAALAYANRVKGREIWRPLAPAVLAEHADTMFDGPLPAAAKFMLAAWEVREQAQPRIPAAVHVDRSARPQLVSRAHSRYHDLIQCFADRTGVPAVINTSFNLAGEPIVHSPHDAVQTFRRSELDVLVLDDLIAVKHSRTDD